MEKIRIVLFLRRFLSQIHRNIHVFLLLPLNMSENSSNANNETHGLNVNMGFQCLTLDMDFILSYFKVVPLFTLTKSDVLKLYNVL